MNKNAIYELSGISKSYKLPNNEKKIWKQYNKISINRFDLPYKKLNNNQKTIIENISYSNNFKRFKK